MLRISELENKDYDALILCCACNGPEVYNCIDKQKEIWYNNSRCKLLRINTEVMSTNDEHYSIFLGTDEDSAAEFTNSYPRRFFQDITLYQRKFDIIFVNGDQDTRKLIYDHGFDLLTICKYDAPEGENGLHEILSDDWYGKVIALKDGVTLYDIIKYILESRIQDIPISKAEVYTFLNKYPINYKSKESE